MECDGIRMDELMEFDSEWINQWSGNTIHIGVLTQGKELEWWEGRTGRTQGDDEAFAGQVPVIILILTYLVVVLT